MLVVMVVVSVVAEMMVVRGDGYDGMVLLMLFNSCDALSACNAGAQGYLSMCACMCMGVCVRERERA